MIIARFLAFRLRGQGRRQAARVNTHAPLLRHAATARATASMPYSAPVAVNSSASGAM